MMRFGQLRHRISIFRTVTTQDSFGAPIKKEVLIGKYWAEVSPISGREFIASQQEQAETTIRVWTRYIPDLQKTDVIHWEPYKAHRILTLQIVSVIQNSAATQLEILCKEGVIK